MLDSKHPGEKLRQAVNEHQPLQVVGTVNAYSAILAEKSGHKAIYLSGGGVAACSFGKPDLGITTLKDVLEDVCDNLFNPDPYKQQGGDMVRVGGISYTCDLRQGIGKRINNMMLNGKAVDPKKNYKVAGWAPVAEGASGEPIWDVVTTYLRDKKVITPRKLNMPKLIGVDGNAGIAGDS